MVNFTAVACRISSRLKWYKNYKNRLRLAKVIVKNKMSRFCGSMCIPRMQPVHISVYLTAIMRDVALTMYKCSPDISLFIKSTTVTISWIVGVSKEITNINPIMNELNALKICGLTSNVAFFIREKSNQIKFICKHKLWKKNRWKTIS